MNREELTEAIGAYNAERELVHGARTSGLKKLKRKFFLPSLAVAIILLAVYFFSGALFAIIGAIVALLVLFGVYFWRRMAVVAPGDTLQEAMRDKILPMIFHDVEGFNFEPEVNGLADDVPSSIMPKFDKGNWGDLVEGNYQGLEFSINEMTLTREERGSNDDNDRTVTVFKGIVVRMKRASSVQSKIILRSNRAAVTKWLSRKTGMGLKLPRVDTNDEDFEKRHDVHCENEKYARNVFSDKGIETFLELERIYSTKGIQFAAKGRTVYMMIEQKYDFFEIPPVSKPFDDVSDVDRLRTEIDGFIALMTSMDALLDG